MNDEEIKKIIGCLSIPRVSAYINLGYKPDSKELIDAYFSLQEISSHFFVPIQIIEISLRNSIHQALSKRFPFNEKNGKNWYDLLPISDDSKKMLLTAKAKAKANDEKKGGSGYSEDDLISNIMFGFWVHMLEPVHVVPDITVNPYHFWQFELDNIFPGRDKHSVNAIFVSLKRINFYRNRLYHHEPVWKGKKVKSINCAIDSLDREYSKILDVIKLLSPEKLNYMLNIGYKEKFIECCAKYKK